MTTINRFNCSYLFAHYIHLQRGSPTGFWEIHERIDSTSSRIASRISIGRYEPLPFLQTYEWRYRNGRKRNAYQRSITSYMYSSQFHFWDDDWSMLSLHIESIYRLYDGLAQANLIMPCVLLVWHYWRSVNITVFLTMTKQIRGTIVKQYKSWSEGKWFRMHEGRWMLMNCTQHEEKGRATIEEVEVTPSPKSLM